MFGFFNRNSEQAPSRLSWTSFFYRGMHAATGGIVLYGMYNDPDNFSPEYVLDAFLHFAEVLLPGEFNEFLIGLNIGRVLQTSSETQCGNHAQIAAIDSILHSSIILARMPGAALSRLRGLREYFVQQPPQQEAPLDGLRPPTAAT